MNKIIRRQFLGSWVLFFVLCISILGIPIAILYYKEWMVTVESGPNLDMTSARQALETYFTLLHEERYADAVAYYGGDYRVLRNWNPPVASNDHAKLLEHGCTINGLQCLALKGICIEEELSPVEYRFTVEFAAPDGSTFVRYPSTERFVYTVLKVDGRFLVQELPPYVP